MPGVLGIDPGSKSTGFGLVAKEGRKLRLVTVGRIAAKTGAPLPERLRQVYEGLREVLDQHARFSPVLRFILVDEKKRTFRAERWCYLGSVDDWIDVGPIGPVRRLARKLIPKLGSDAFFDLY